MPPRRTSSSPNGRAAIHAWPARAADHFRTQEPDLIYPAPFVLWMAQLSGRCSIGRSRFWLRRCNIASMQQEYGHVGVF